MRYLLQFDSIDEIIKKVGILNKSRQTLHEWSKDIMERQGIKFVEELEPLNLLVEVSDLNSDQKAALELIKKAKDKSIREVTELLGITEVN